MRHDKLFSLGEKNHLLSSRAVFLIELIAIVSLCIGYYKCPSVALMISIIAAFIVMYIFNHFVPMNFKSRYINRDVTAPGLRSFFGIGTTMFRAYRSFGGKEIRYQFFTFFFIPILPLGCYSASKGDWEFTTSFPGFGIERDYGIEGMVDSNALEILNIYLRFAIFVSGFYWVIISWVMDKVMWIINYVHMAYS